MAEVLLKDWGFFCGSLMGRAYGHPGHEDGAEVTSSAVTGAQGRVVQTRSGRTYRLVAEPRPDFLRMCVSLGWPMDLRDPISPMLARSSHRKAGS